MNKLQVITMMGRPEKQAENGSDKWETIYAGAALAMAIMVLGIVIGMLIGVQVAQGGV